MRTQHHLGLWRYLKQSASALGIVGLSVLTTLMVQHLLIPPPATAQSSQAQEVRASAFVLVGSDGTVLGRLTPGTTGDGQLTLFDSAGTRRLSASGKGSMYVFDPDGNTWRFAAGYQAASGVAPSLNGVWLDAKGTIGVVPISP